MIFSVVIYDLILYDVVFCFGFFMSIVECWVLTDSNFGTGNFRFD